LPKLKTFVIACTPNVAVGQTLVIGEYVWKITEIVTPGNYPTVIAQRMELA
jgi:hypothetical protein